MLENKYFTNEFSEEVWNLTYKNYKDKDISDNWKRIAKTLASCEETDKQEVEKKFYSIIKDFNFVPGGRIYSNAGTDWNGTTFINCFVNDRQKNDIDSLDGILNILRDQAQTLKSEGGWGCNFSFIRPRGSFIKGIGVESPGSVKYMELFDKSSDIITSGSGKKSKNPKAKKKIRKGAMMGILDCWHPDIEEFITSKQSEGRLSKFNISVGAYNDFMDKVVKIQKLKDKGEKIPKDLDSWDLVFPDTEHPKYKKDWYGDIYDWKEKGYPIRVYKTISVSELWDLIMSSTYNRNDPGVLFLDVANRTHCWNYGPKEKSKILATNPCGEQSLPSAGCCNLGSFNLVKYLKEDFSGFDFEKIKQHVRVAVRLLDNVNSVSKAPLKSYIESMTERRRIGLGIMGWGSALFLMKIRYASNQAEKIKEEFLKAFVYTAIDQSINLAKEKGHFFGCDKEKHYKNEYYDIIGLPEKIRSKIKKYGIRNSSLFSIQPTGNTGILANMVSGGLEPIFMPEYIRTSIVPDCPDHIKDKCPKYWENEFKETEMFKLQKEGSDDILVGTDEFGVVYKIDRNRGLTKETLCQDYSVKILKEKKVWDKKADWAVTTTELSAEEHIQDMKGWAKYIDSAISKTLNIPNDFSYENFKKIYLDCYETGYIKGFTTYRAGTMTSVLKSVEQKEESLELDCSSAPKRPRELDCDIHIAVVKDKKYIIAVGFLNDQPYEIFGGKSNGFAIKKTCKGRLIKHKKGQYGLEIGDFEIDDFSKHFTPEEQTIFRMASTSLRHGVPIEFIAEQMQKSTDDMFSLPRAVARVLKKYIKNDKKVTGQKCEVCKGPNLIYQEGCVVCKDCGNSKCS